MKIRIIPVLSAIYILLLFFLAKSFSIMPLILFLAALAIDIYAARISPGIKNLGYLAAALSSFLPLFWLFVFYLPYAVFGTLFPRSNFIKNYVIGFALSFVPFTIIYLISTYLSIPINIPIVVIIYLIPVLAMFFILKKKSIEGFCISDLDGLLLFVILISVTIVGIVIVNNDSLFMSNGTRVFSTMEYAVEHLLKNNEIPLYNPGAGQGEATFLFDSPSRAAQYIVEKYVLRHMPSILFFNAHSFFILLMSVLSLSVLFSSVANRKNTLVDVLAISGVSVIVGLSFHFLQLLESLKQFTAFPIGYLIIGLVLENPRTYREFLLLMYLFAIIIPIHSAYGIGTLIFAISIFLVSNIKMVRERSEIKKFFAWVWSNKILALITITVIILIPLFYLSSGIIYKDFFMSKGSASEKPSLNMFKNSIAHYFESFYIDDIRVLSLRYPDVRRIDDQVIGPFLTVFGVSSLIILLLLYKIRGLDKLRSYAIGYILYLVIMSLVSPYGIMVSGLFRTNKPFLIIMMGVSILYFIGLFNKKLIKISAITIVFFAFFHSVPYASANLGNIHNEKFMGGEIMKNELDFIRQLPIDGRIMDYGVFNNAIDFGSSQLTGRYFAREEREELLYHINNIYYKIHGPHSFGMEDFVFNKSGVELYNYLRLGGYKYTLLNICHPAGNFIAKNIYPDFSAAIYQNECMVILSVNGTSYAEKIDLVKKVNEDTYRKEGGYRHDSIREGYPSSQFMVFADSPKEPVPLEFKKISPIEVIISGSFSNDDWVIFKERYWPRWKAFMGNKGLSVYPDQFEQLLIKASDGNSIVLKYGVLPIERVFGIASLAGFVFFIFILAYCAKKEV